MKESVSGGYAASTPPPQALRKADGNSAVIRGVKPIMTSTDDPDDPGIILPDDVAALPPSCQQVYVLLREYGPLTLAGLLTHGMKERTARWAIDRLEDIECIEARPNETDARQTVYAVAPSDE